MYLSKIIITIINTFFIQGWIWKWFFFFVYFYSVAVYNGILILSLIIMVIWMMAFFGVIYVSSMMFNNFFKQNYCIDWFFFSIFFLEVSAFCIFCMDFVGTRRFSLALFYFRVCILNIIIKCRLNGKVFKQPVTKRRRLTNVLCLYLLYDMYFQ